MTKYLLPAVALVAAAPVAAQAGAEAQITAAMEASAAAWNRGDLKGFVAVYAPDAIFAAGNNMIRNKDEIAAHFAHSFVPGGNTRGTLRFDYLAWRRISAVHHLLVGRYTLVPPGGAKPLSGTTTLLFERRKDGWRIISDHSS